MNDRPLPDPRPRMRSGSGGAPSGGTAEIAGPGPLSGASGIIPAARQGRAYVHGPADRTSPACGREPVRTAMAGICAARIPAYPAAQKSLAFLGVSAILSEQTERGPDHH